MPLRSHVRHVPSGVVLVSVAGMLWGTAPIAFDLVHDRTALTALAISAHRLTIAAVMLLGLAVVVGRLGPAWRALRGRPVMVVALGAAVAGYQALWFAAIPLVGASIATVLSLGLAPVLVTGWEDWRARTRPSAGRLFVVVAAVSGLALVSISPGHPDGPSAAPVLGLLLATGSGILYAATTVLGRHVASHVAPLPLTTASTTVGAVILLPLAALTGPVLTVDAPSLLALAYLGIVTMALGYLLLYAGLRTAPASAAAVATLLEPITATVLAVALLGERITPAAAVGICLILSAVATLNLRQPRAGSGATTTGPRDRAPGQPMVKES